MTNNIHMTVEAILFFLLIYYLFINKKTKIERKIEYIKEKDFDSVDRHTHQYTVDKLWGEKSKNKKIMDENNELKQFVNNLEELMPSLSYIRTKMRLNGFEGEAKEIQIIENLLSNSKFFKGDISNGG